MAYLADTKALTHKAVLDMLAAAVAEAEAQGQPQCISIVDASAVPLGELRMTGSKVISRKSARAKALTAASTGKPSDTVPDVVRAGIGMATGGVITGLPGGLPIVFNGVLVGGIGVGSGAGPQDIAVAAAALAAIGADPQE